MYLFHLPVQETGTTNTNSTNTPVLSLSMTLSVYKNRFISSYFFLSFLVASHCLTLILPSLLIKGSGWTSYLSVDWDLVVCTTKKSCSLKHPQNVSLTVLFYYFHQNMTKFIIFDLFSITCLSCPLMFQFYCTFFPLLWIFINYMWLKLQINVLLSLHLNCGYGAIQDSNHTS